MIAWAPRHGRLSLGMPGNLVWPPSAKSAGCSGARPPPWCSLFRRHVHGILSSFSRTSFTTAPTSRFPPRCRNFGPHWKFGQFLNFGVPRMTESGVVLVLSSMRLMQRLTASRVLQAQGAEDEWREWRLRSNTEVGQVDALGISSTKLVSQEIWQQ